MEDIKIPARRNAISQKMSMAQLLLPKLAGVGTGITTNAYSQKELLELYRISDRRIRSLFLNTWIERRHLSLPELDQTGLPRVETQSELLAKHKKYGVIIGRQSIIKCLEQAQADVADVRHICCVTSTGFMTPGYSALLINDLGLPRDCSRLDIVGMGCNAGLNALSSVSSWASTHPGQLALVVCIEVCSAAYVFDGSMRTSVVNSLFGDGSAAVAVIADKKANSNNGLNPTVLRFSSYIIPDTLETMKYDWNDEQGKFSFFLDQEVPYLIGQYAEIALNNLLTGTGVSKSDIRHWLIHSGGKKVIDSIRVNLGLTQYDVRHTISTLRDYGNLSSGSFLFSYERLICEGKIVAGDYGIMMTMGPGATIELALLHWKA